MTSSKHSVLFADVCLSFRGMAVRQIEITFSPLLYIVPCNAKVSLSCFTYPRVHSKGNSAFISDDGILHILKCRLEFPFHWFSKISSWWKRMPRVWYTNHAFEPLVFSLADCCGVHGGFHCTNVVMVRHFFLKLKNKIKQMISL